MRMAIKDVAQLIPADDDNLKEFLEAAINCARFGLITADSVPGVIAEAYALGRMRERREHPVFRIQEAQ